MAESLSFWDRLKDYIFTRSPERTFKDRTTAWVTFAVIALLTFVVWIVSSGAEGPDGKVTETFANGTTRTVEGPIVNPSYVDLLSDIALIIAASFTTVIGYYFGNRNAENQAKEMTADAQAAVKQVEQEKAEINGQLEGLRSQLKVGQE